LAALLTVVSEQVALRCAAGDRTVTVDDCTRAASSARRALADGVGLKPPTDEEKEAAFIRAALARKYSTE
jgi:hypothetical protein